MWLASRGRYEVITEAPPMDPIVVAYRFLRTRIEIEEPSCLCNHRELALYRSEVHRRDAAVIVTCNL